MPSGMEISNSSGQIVADVTSPTLALRNKYTVTIPAGPNLTSILLEVPNTEYPTFAIRPLTDGKPTTILFNNPKSGAPTTRVLTIAWLADLADDEPSTPSPTTTSYQVVVYHFDRPVASGNFGLQLFDETGKCTFDALSKPAMVVGSGFTFATHTFASGRTGAAIPYFGFRGRVYKVDSVSLWKECHYREGVTKSGQTITVSQHCVFSNDLAPTEDFHDDTHGNPGGLLVDVTGY